MEQTSQYQFSQWAETDRIQREDFNADNFKAEQALAELATQAAQIANCGNCQIYTTSYTGAGNTTARTLTFPAKPVVVMISNAAGDGNMIFWQGMQNARMHNSSYTMTVTWSGNTVTWQSSSGVDQMMNRSGATYVVAALLSKGE